MNGWLVVVRCSMDEIPIGLFATKDEAWTFAGSPVACDAAFEEACRVLRIDVTNPLNVSVYAFADGKLVGFARWIIRQAAEVARDLEDDE